MSDEEKKPRRVKLRVNCSGYQGQPCSVFAAYDLDHDVLVIVKEEAYDTSERPGFVRMTNRDKDPFHDLVFSEDCIEPAVLAFFDMHGMGLIRFGDGGERMNPNNKIERDGLTLTGQKYRFNPDITNSQVATLFASWGARQQAGASASQDFFAALTTI